MTASPLTTTTDAQPFTEVEEERLANSFGVIGKAWADAQLDWFAIDIHAPQPHGFGDGLAAHLSAWLRNVWMRPNHRWYAYEIALRLADDGVIHRVDTDEEHPYRTWEATS